MFSSPASPYLNINRSRGMLFFSLMCSITAFTCSHECCSFCLLPEPAPVTTTLQSGLALICEVRTANCASIPVVTRLPDVNNKVPAPIVPHLPCLPLPVVSWSVLQSSGQGH